MQFKAHIVLSALISFGATADDFYFITGAFSKHYSYAGQNETHPSVGIQYNNFSAIYIEKNSIENQSIQIAYGDNFVKSKWIDLGYRIGIATGYQDGTVFDNGRRTYFGRDLGYGVIPIVAAEITMHTPIPDFSIAVDFLPNAVAFGTKIKLR